MTIMKNKSTSRHSLHLKHQNLVLHYLSCQNNFYLKNQETKNTRNLQSLYQLAQLQESRQATQNYRSRPKILPAPRTYKNFSDGNQVHLVRDIQTISTIKFSKSKKIHRKRLKTIIESQLYFYIYFVFEYRIYI